MYPSGCSGFGRCEYFEICVRINIVECFRLQVNVNVHVAFLSLNRFKIFHLLFCLWISPFLIRIYQKPNLNGNVCQAFDL